MLGECWPDVGDDGPTFNQHWDIVARLWFFLWWGTRLNEFCHPRQGRELITIFSVLNVGTLIRPLENQ